MEFDNEHKVIVDTLNRNEAMAFVMFLNSEILCHKDDIKQARKLVYRDRDRRKIL